MDARARYINSHIADIRFVHGFCNDNARAAACEYHEKIFEIMKCPLSIDIECVASHVKLLLAKLEKKLNQQTFVKTTAVKSNVMEALNEKLSSSVKENNNLKKKGNLFRTKIKYRRKRETKHNLIYLGIQEMDKTETELVEYIKELIVGAGVHLDSQEINCVQRISRWTEKKNRPVVVSFSFIWQKRLIIKNKTNFLQGIYIKEDSPKEIFEKKRKLQVQVEEERKKGNFA
ncbi:hypothetical protein EVAR_43797_1 [Eumeta japonica]|uniref:Uncharacterized protein n=1 Tax=Eumeta variegata TaxID=151549 RepID=A0A4C1XTJ2_EUMVA|nr:hypothetical protein EVAR_43797_1 [Eumeta japonica]